MIAVDGLVLRTGAVSAALLVATSVWLLTGPVMRRDVLWPPSATRDVVSRRSSFSLVEDDRARTVLCAASMATIGGLLLGWFGVAFGAGVGAVVGQLLGRLERPSVVREREQLVRDLPLAVYLLAACAQAGLPLPLVLSHVARAVGGPLERRLAIVASRWELGADPIREWRQLESDPVLSGLGAALVRAHRSGAPLTETLTRVAADTRRQVRARVLAAARSVGVSSAGPLAVCFLPAFLLIGVVPTVVGGFTHLL